MYNKAMMEQALNDSGLKKNYVASRLGISRASLSSKIAGSREFKASEIDTLRSLLRLNPKDVEQIFFA